MTCAYFDEFELNSDLPESIYFKAPLGSDGSDEEDDSTKNASTTRSGRTYAAAKTTKVQYKPGFDIHEGKEVDIKGYLSIGNEDFDPGGVVSISSTRVSEGLVSIRKREPRHA